MTELEELARDLFTATPGLRDALGDEAEPDADIPTLWAADLGHALTAMARRQPPETLAAGFSVIERHLHRGSQWMRDVIATGLLEALASDVSGGRLDPAVLASLLGPQSRAFIDAWDQFTLGRSSLDPT